MKEHGKNSGVRWLCRKLKVSTNAYYNYLKQRKAPYYEQKAKVQRFISESFHRSNGTMGVKMMSYYCANHGYSYFLSTIRKYMKELNISLIIRRKKQPFKTGKQHKVFTNLIQQNFHVTKPNRLWCVDFTYLYLRNGTPRYNCTIIDVYDRRVVASQNSTSINSRLAINTLHKALLRYYPDKGLILHSDQGSQFTSKLFSDFCKQRFIQESMSCAGCPYDNAVMERYFNTLKHECTNHNSFTTEERMDSIMNDFEQKWYNSKRTHTYNNGLSPNQIYIISTLM
ncbi:IS3 family transposase [Erysipelothrix anatis]|uniref:IS3 family transposase n=1 Tax=Erysipelothrix anatis TaxID=2683713 RepID=UPI00312C7A02